MSIDDDRQISRFVPDRLPEFVRVDHPTLVAFLEAYYEWLGLRRDSGIVVSPMAMHDIPDVDTSLEQFISQFKSQYLFNFPESLAVNKQTGETVDPRRLIKNIKQFYLAKGTEKSYEFLFRIFYDTNVEFYYPKKDILRLSSGRWTQNNYLRISNSLGDQIYRSPGNLIIQKSANGEILATAKVVDVNVMQIDNFDVAELLITGRNGTFQTGDLGVEFTDGSDTFKEVRVFSVVSTVDILNGGSNYQVGERINFVSNTGDGGQRGRATIAEVDATGSVRKINIDDYGINYTNPPQMVIETARGTGFSGTVTVGSLCQSFGYYMNNDGRLSTNKVLQDNHYYQNWSYVLKAEVVIDTYRELIRRLVHPVGMGMFGSILIKRCSRANLDNASAMMSFRIPYIGNYTPYTFQTFDDLSLWFQESITGGMTAAGYSANAHDDLLKGIGNRTAPIGNPISNNIEFKAAESGWLSTPGFPNADPFWIIYPHANKQVDRGYHYALIWKSQISDFLLWPEWSYNQTDRTNLSEFNRYVGRLNSAEYTEYMQSQMAEGGIAGENCPCTEPQCRDYLEGDPPACVGQLRIIPGQGAGGSDCCCCDGEINEGMGLSIQKCLCIGGSFLPIGDGFECTCPAGYVRIEAQGGCGFICVSNGGGGGGGGGGGSCEEAGCDPICERCVNNGGEWWCAPECNPENLGQCPCTNCNPACPDFCCPDGSCPDDGGSCVGCEDEEYAAENCCECFPGSDCCIPPECDPNDPLQNCCFEDPCTELCSMFCSNFPTHPFCVNRCTFFPCCPGCTAECNPECPQFDPCLTSCPGFDYCVTGVSGWSNSVIEDRAARCPQYGPCYDGPLPHGYEPCYDKCTATGCSGYSPCHVDCEPNFCDEAGECYDPCKCDTPCLPCNGVIDWCACDPTGPTCCADFPCQLGCNPDFCDPSYANGQCFNPCDPSCTPDFCNPANAGFGCYLPCHPDCNPNNCNPLCPGFDRCNTDCPNWDRDFCCQGCNCGDGGGVGDPVYRDIDGDVRRWEEDNGFNPNDNLCNNDISRCFVGPHAYNHDANLGALLRYNENSEFRKITLRAFFNMPKGDAFDCREERIVNVAVPKFVVMSPKSGATNETSDLNRPLLIQFRVTNQENIAYYDIVQANVYIDNRLRSTISINTRELTISGIQDGRRTLKLEMIDRNGMLVQGTQEIVIFGYQYSQTSRSQATTQRASIDDSLQESGRVYGIFAGMNGGISFPTLASTTVGGPTVEEGSVVIGGGPDPSLNMGGRRDMSCRVPCDNQYLEDQRITENIYESLRNDNKSDFDRCLRDVRDGGTLRRLYEGWLQGGDAGGLLPKGEPVNIPLVECCVPPPPEDPSQPEGVPCPSASREGLCIDDFPPEYCLDRDDPRKKVYEWFQRAHRCKVEMCYGNLGYDGQSLRNGGPPPFNGPNWCIDDTQKQIDDAINDMKRVLCVERACNGPVSENCPNKHYTLVEICRLEALKRLRCGLFDAYRDFNVIECSWLQDAAQEMAKAHRTHCNGVPPIENPCGNNDLGWDTPIEENAILRCRVRIREKEREMFDRAESDFAEVIRSLTNQWKGLQETYDAEVIACGCSGQDVPDDIYPTLYPHWYDARRIGRDPSSYPDYWADPLGNGRWYPGESDPMNADRQRFWGQQWPNWLPLPGRDGFGRW